MDSLSSNADHPADAELVFQHAEARRPKGLVQRHGDFAAVGQRVEITIGFGFRGHRERHREALETFRLRTATVRGHDGRLAHAEAGVHDLVAPVRRHHARRRRFRAVLEAHDHLDFRAEGFAIELNGLLTIAAEEEVRFNE